jgi:glutamate formiminotransferase/glutamate formiminotransferase/formiminotetrahydrofolate cyclodeaminase
VRARDAFGAWAAAALGLPGFAYGPERTLPEVRRHAFAELAPTWGPPRPHPRAGAVAVGARPVLVAYNLWLAPGTPLATARAVASRIRSAEVRALGLQVGRDVQVSMNLVAPELVGPAAVWDAVAAEATIARAELVGLLPDVVLRGAPAHRWAQLDLAEDRTIEARLAEGLRRRRAR